MPRQNLDVDSHRELPKDAEEATIRHNQKFLDLLDFSDTTDFEDATFGFIDTDIPLKIKNADGGPAVWNLERYKRFIPEQDTPPTVNPSLWRNAQLNVINGLFQIHEDIPIYQVRAYDLSNVTFVRSNSGWIAMDPLISAECAKAAYELLVRWAETDGGYTDNGIKAVVYSHSHIDHYGGVRGLVSEDEIDSIPIYAPEGFSEHAISENVIAGNAMSRRAVYMYGALLMRNERGSVGAGLGVTTSTGTTGLIVPKEKHTISETRTKVVEDGVTMIFQLTPGSEAPSEMNTWFSDWKALWMAENTTNTMHNILTLRGAQVRNALIWAKYIQETIDWWGRQAVVKFQAHHWPVRGNEKIMPYLVKHRDCYKFMHDQTVRLMNKGYVGEEIAEVLRFPTVLEQNWATREYYGTLSHNVKAVYQFYMGWYSGNPSDLHKLTPQDEADKYVKYMGGECAVLRNAQYDFSNGEYRWVAQVLKHVVFANPDNEDAKSLLADAYEQLGYQAESGPWRCCYLQGAHELRNGLPKLPPVETDSPDTIRAMSPSMMFDYFAVHVIPEVACEGDMTIMFVLTDQEYKERYWTVNISNGTLNYTTKKVASATTVTTEKAVLDDIQLGETDWETALANGDISVAGDTSDLLRFVNMLDSYPFWFNIVTPRPDPTTGQDQSQDDTTSDRKDAGEHKKRGKGGARRGREHVTEDKEFHDEFALSKCNGC